MTTLIIDDDPFFTRLLTRQLGSLGQDDIVAHHSGAEALAALAPGSVSLILCDLQMPGMDGIEVVRQLTRIGFDGALALISGEDERILQSAQALASAHRLRVVGALPKPVTRQALAELLARAAAPVPSVGPRRQLVSYDSARLLAAIEQGEISCFVQPKVAMADGRLVGVECLARWHHPTDGLVFPDSFIPLAEEAGLIGKLTELVLVDALGWARRWRDQGLAIQVAVNVSMDDLTALDFPERLLGHLDRAGLGADALELEVTESRLIQDRRRTLDIVTRLRLKRIGLSIDDFGTGNSTLAQLRDIPFNELKIDRSFVHGAHQDATMRAILNASVHIGRELGLTIVAEGAEDLQDWRLLRAANCDCVQGYFISRPMPPDDLVDWARQWARRYAEIEAAAFLPG